MKPYMGKGLVNGIFIILTFILSIVSYKRNLLWHDDLSLWQDTVIKSTSKSRPFNSLGVACANMKMYDRAIESFKTAIKNGSGLKEVHHYNLAMAYRDKGLLNEAVFELNEAIMLKRDYVDAHYRLGLLYRDLSMMEEAASELKKAIAYSPDRGAYYNDLGNIYLIQKRYELAIEQYKRSLQLSPGNVESIYNLALSYDSINMREDAIRYYRKFAEEAPAEYRSAIENAINRERELKRSLQ